LNNSLGGAFMFKITTKNILIIIIILVILFLGYYSRDTQQDEVLNLASDFTLEANNELKNQSAAKESTNAIIVHLSGEVKNPGVYRLNTKERLVDLVKAGGGLKEKADLEQINLAEKLYDGQKVVIPKIIERNNNFGVNSDSKISGNILNKYSNSEDNNLININQADQIKLETLSGIGPAKASAIIKYRDQNNFFTKKEDLLNISGIGEKTLENIEDEIIIK
jgi:competence protein ComEA